MSILIPAGATLTAEKLNALGCRHAFKLTDEPLPSNTGHQPDNELFFSVAANKRYVLSGVLFVTGPDGNNIGEISCRWTMPTGCVIDWGTVSQTFGLASGNIGDAAMPASHDTASPTTALVIGTSVARTVAQVYAFVRTGAAAGTLQFQWAQNTANATPSTIREGSFMALEEIVS